MHMQDILPDGVDPHKCILTTSLIWFLGFTMVLCWSILQLPDGGGKPAWVPDIFCSRSILMPLRHIAFAVPSIFWPITLFILMARHAEIYVEASLAPCRSRRRRRARKEAHDIEEAHLLLPNEETLLSGEGGVRLSDFSDLSGSPRSSYDSTSDGPLSRSPRPILSIMTELPASNSARKFRSGIF